MEKKSGKHIFSFFFFTLISWSSFSQAPNWQWAKGAGGMKDDQGTSISTDVNGNSFMTGLFKSDTMVLGSLYPIV